MINSAFYIPLAFVNIVRFLIRGMGYSKFAILAGVFEMVARTLVGFAFVPVFRLRGGVLCKPGGMDLCGCIFIPGIFPCPEKDEEDVVQVKE